MDRHQTLTLVAAAFEGLEGVTISVEPAIIISSHFDHPPRELHLSVPAPAGTPGMETVLRSFDEPDLSRFLARLVADIRSLIRTRGEPASRYHVLPGFDSGQVFHWPLRVDGYPVRALMYYEPMHQGWMLTLDVWAK